MRKEKRKLLSLILSLLLALGGLAAACGGTTTEKRADYDILYAAAEQMERCMARVREYKAELGLSLCEEDIHGTGLLGDYVTEITTTLGAPEAKRTTANSDMAALAVTLLREAGVREGDTVGAGFSGSFPALDLAVLCACDAMGVRCVYIASVGSSTYGANQPELTLPDIVCRLVQDGCLSTLPAAITPGGAYDIGYDMEQDVLSDILTRLERYGVPIVRESSFSENIAWRMALYESLGPICCFVGVGGNVTTLGRDGTTLRQGVTYPGRTGLISERSGLLERYSAAGLPVVQFLNIKQLVADYALPYDPDTLPSVGTSAIYYETHYAPIPAAAGLVAATGALWWGFGRRRKAQRSEEEPS